MTKPVITTVSVDHIAALNDSTLHIYIDSQATLEQVGELVKSLEEALSACHCPAAYVRAVVIGQSTVVVEAMFLEERMKPAYRVMLELLQPRYRSVGFALGSTWKFSDGRVAAQIKLNAQVEFGEKEQKVAAAYDGEPSVILSADRMVLTIKFYNSKLSDVRAAAREIAASIQMKLQVEFVPVYAEYIN